MSEALVADRIEVQITHPGKVLFPEAGLTKMDLARYYQRIAEVMLPHLRGRPISMRRFPDGISGEGFYQKEAPGYFPDWINRVSVGLKDEGGTQRQITCENAATLVYLAGQDCLEIHPWLSRADDLDHPDRLIFDLDPPSEDFEVVRFAAGAARKLLGELGLPSFLMTTGSRGLHVVVPLDRSADFDACRDFARRVAAVLAGRYPDRLTSEVRKEKRQGRLFLDYLRNAYGQTAVAPYGVRAKPGAPVATPLDWEELGDRSLYSQRYRLENIFRRLGQKEDPWRDMMQHAVSLEGPLRLLSQIRSDS